MTPDAVAQVVPAAAESSPPRCQRRCLSTPRSLPRHLALRGRVRRANKTLTAHSGYPRAPTRLSTRPRSTPTRRY